ncbi:hypothetical protein Pmani_028561 [Petrolisthes manimaculis]|uniref:NADH dehydrogenase [ubiquinone] 1 alpha subcomplex subunit 10, mitochondrial n=1 Tax=Petrolisthes manimaculis TaxID=1843537 RepID=A0AAE1NZW8_9EUCA|nr:hypothetical protein Pmani_028561 [Petrolisthes manimaculis]
MAVCAVRAGVLSSLRRRGGGVGGTFLSPRNNNNNLLRPLAAAGIMSKAMRPKDYARPPPFPYKDHHYGFFQSLIDGTTHRLDDNSKIVVVDGPIAVGKTKFAKEIADELDMLYVPQASMDMVYINHYGQDFREMDPRLPLSVQSFDEKDFLRNPNHPNVAGFQMAMFHVRLEQYINALAHLLSTGQGIVMEGSVYSDFVYVEAMVRCGYISKQVKDYYYECRQMTVPELMRPHLVIYLDCAVDEVLRRIKARALPHETNSPVLTPQFLTHMENIYKQQHLKQISTQAELLIYDWSGEGEPEVVVEDIERIDFSIDTHSVKFEDWQLKNEDEWGEQRCMYTKRAYQIMLWASVPRFNVPELIVNADDYKVYEDVYYSSPGNKYARGFNSDMGDQFILGKLKTEPRTTSL